MGGDIINIINYINTNLKETNDNQKIQISNVLINDNCEYKCVLFICSKSTNYIIKINKDNKIKIESLVEFLKNTKNNFHFSAIQDYNQDCFKLPKNICDKVVKQIKINIFNKKIFNKNEVD